MTPDSDTKLVFASGLHKFLDIVLAPYAVRQTGNGEFGLSCKRLNSDTLGDYINDCSEQEKQIVRLLDGCRDEELMRKFSGNTRTAGEFFMQLSEARLKGLVIPYVQKRTDHCLRIMMQSGIPLYTRGHKKDPVNPEPLTIQKEAARAVFNFIRRPSESHYSLTLRHGGRDISVRSAESQVLVNTPGWILTGGSVYHLEPGMEGGKVRPFFTKDHIAIPRSAELKYFSSFVTNAIKKHEVKTAGFDIIEESPECKPALSLENDLAGYPVLVLYFVYGDKKCRREDKNHCWVEFVNLKDNYSFRKTLRDSDSEKKIIALLASCGLYSSDQHLFYLSGPETRNDPANENASLYALVKWIGEYSDELDAAGIRIRQRFFRENFYTGKADILVNLEEGNDWFDVRAWAVFGTFRIPFPDLKYNILSGKREYPLPDGQIAILPEEWFSRYSDLFIYGKQGADRIKLEKHHFMVAAEADPRKRDLVQLYEPGKQVAGLPDLPRGLSAILRPYQAEGFYWMYFLAANNLGGCLADDMGLGKTLQTLSLLWKLKTDNPPRELTPKPERQKAGKAPVQLDLFSGPHRIKESPVNTSLVVMPLSLMHNWEAEIIKFTPGLKCMRYIGLNREMLSENLAGYDVVLTTYGVVRNDFQFLKKFGFFYLILDESQVIKNPDSKISRAVRQLRAKHRLVLTGTPVENSLTDLWSQLSFLNPGILGPQKLFEEQYVLPIEKYNCQEKKDRLMRIIRPFILRRTKKLVEKDLPDLSEKIHYCEMGEEQRQLYDSKKSEIRNLYYEKALGGNKGELNIIVLQGLMKLRLIANHPGLAGNAEGISGKFEEVTGNIENLLSGGHKILIFSQFVRHLRIYREFFDKQNLKYSYLTGELNDSRRKEVIREFQDDPGNQLFLISLRAGGVGLNLTAADYVFLLDPWWNPAVEQQAISRAHRIGQKRNVICCKYITTGTVEEKILLIQQKKAELAGSIINTNNPLKFFAGDEIIDLFT